MCFPLSLNPIAARQKKILGGMIEGITVRDGAFAGGSFDWATPFSLLCGLALIAAALVMAGLALNLLWPRLRATLASHAP